MKLTQTILIVSATSLVVAFTSQSAAMGFSLSFAGRGARDLYIAKESNTYMNGNEEITVLTTLFPPHVTEMPLGGTRTLDKLLDDYRVMAYQNYNDIWKFTKANKDLKGNLEVLQY
ncbi:hypothetical protein QT995_09760 [Microcoleus sp. S36b_A3]|uniref:hypothetical protein n=1 Tax=unclassified Microcoleus TaxID=2642155 RepID=UPI002FD69571